MLTKIREGWWVDLSKVIYFEKYNKDKLCTNERCLIKLSNNNNHDIYLSNLHDVKLFEIALGKYYHNDVKSEAKKVMLQYHTAIENLADR